MPLDPNLKSPLYPVEYVFIHHTAVSRKENPDQFAATNAYHQRLWNFRSNLGFYAGYNYEIAADGTLRRARQEGEETAAVIGYNKKSISICLDGDFDIEFPTQDQAKVLRALLIKIQSEHKVPLDKIVPHRFACGNPPYKSCYGNRLTDVWAQLLITDPDKVGVSVDPNVPPLGVAHVDVREAQ